MAETMYVALEVETEPSLEVVDHPEMICNFDIGKMVGFLSVYATLEDLRSDYPDADYVYIREGRMVARPEVSTSPEK